MSILGYVLLFITFVYLGISVFRDIREGWKRFEKDWEE